MSSLAHETPPCCPTGVCTASTTSRNVGLTSTPACTRNSCGPTYPPRMIATNSNATSSACSSPLPNPFDGSSTGTGNGSCGDATENINTAIGCSSLSTTPCGGGGRGSRSASPSSMTYTTLSVSSQSNETPAHTPTNGGSHVPNMNGYDVPTMDTHVDMTLTSAKASASKSKGSRPTRESVLRRLSEALLRRSLTEIDLSQRHLQPKDAKLIMLAIMQNCGLHTLKLGYNNLGDEGVTTLSRALGGGMVDSQRASRIRNLDIGFNSVGDAGMQALAEAFLRDCCVNPNSIEDKAVDAVDEISCVSKSAPTRGAGNALQTLYLAGNSIGRVGSLALARMIEFGSCRNLSKLHLTGNTIGAEGVIAVTTAVAASERERKACTQDQMQGEAQSSSSGIEELFLGGTSMGTIGCRAVADMLAHTSSLKVLSLAANKLDDVDCNILARSIKQHRSCLPFEALHLSFNAITCVAVESLMNAFWTSTTLRELRLDNNKIGDRGIQLIAVVLGNVPSIERLDVGFNSFSATGTRALMKSVAENKRITSLSISGNKLDTSAAKAVAYALAYNASLKYFFMDNCSVSHSSQRHITAGIVSNSGVCLHTLTGFRIGAVAVTLGLPPALEQWTNEQALKFIVLMWTQMQQESSDVSMAPDLDPLNFLPSARPDSNGNPVGESRRPLDPATVVAVAKKAYASLGGDRGAAGKVLEGSFKNEGSCDPSLACPLVEDIVMVEANNSGKGSRDAFDGTEVVDFSTLNFGDPASYNSDNKNGNGGQELCKERLNPVSESWRNNDLRPCLPPPSYPRLDTAARRRRNVDWLCHHVRHLHELSKLPFNSAELWRLHHHFFSPSIQNNSVDIFSTPIDRGERQDVDAKKMDGRLVPVLNRPNSAASEPCAMSSFAAARDSTVFGCAGAQWQSNTHTPSLIGNPLSAGLERKVSYRSLNDAFVAPSTSDRSSRASSTLKDRGRTISSVMGEGMGSHSLQPRPKRPRKNRSRISFFPRIKEKLDASLEKCHQTALVTMRQLSYVEKTFMTTYMRVEESEPCYITNALAKDVETILLDLI